MDWLLPDGGSWLSATRIDGKYLLRFHDRADFLVNPDGREIICVYWHENSGDTVRHLFLDQVMPLVLNLRGGEAVHASAVLVENGVIAFLGPTGAGKSTLAGMFFHAGLPPLSDDCLALVEREGGFNAVPAYPGLRLWKDALDCLFGDGGEHPPVAHYSKKRRVRLDRNPRGYCDEPQPVRCFYTLADPAEADAAMNLAIEMLSPRDALVELIRRAFRFDWEDKEMLERQLRFFSGIAAEVPMRRIVIPRDLSLLPAMRRAILQDLGPWKGHAVTHSVFNVSQSGTG